MASEAERDKRVQQAKEWLEGYEKSLRIRGGLMRWQLLDAMAAYRAFGEAEAYRKGIKAAKSLVYLDYERHTKDRIVDELERLAREAEERK